MQLGLPEKLHAWGTIRVVVARDVLGANSAEKITISAPVASLPSSLPSSPRPDGARLLKRAPLCPRQRTRRTSAPDLAGQLPRHEQTSTTAEGRSVARR
jgi:hypothetical protein